MNPNDEYGGDSGDGVWNHQHPNQNHQPSQNALSNSSHHRIVTKTLQTLRASTTGLLQQRQQAQQAPKPNFKISDDDDDDSSSSNNSRDEFAADYHDNKDGDGNELYEGEDENADDEERRVYDVPINHPTTATTTTNSTTHEKGKKKKNYKNDKNTNNTLNGLSIHTGCGSLPVVDEVRMIRNKNRTSNKSISIFKKKNFWIWIGSLLVLIIFIGYVTTRLVTKRNRNNSVMEMIGGTKERKVDLVTLSTYLQNKYNITIVAPSSINSASSPQYMAAKFMTELDGSNWNLPGSSFGTNLEDDITYEYRYLARYIMALNYYSLHGPTWYNTLNFLSEKDICHWYGYVQTTSNSNIGSSSTTTTTTTETTNNNQMELAGIFCDITTGVPIALSLCK